MLNAEHNVDAELPTADDVRGIIPPGNGTVLPPARLAIVEQGNRITQELAAERDDLVRKLMQRDQDIALYKISLEGKDMQITELQSWVAAYRAERDAAVAKAAKVETVNASAMAVLRAGEVENVPLIKERNDDEPAIGGA